MRLKLSVKLFLAIVAACAVLVVINSIIGRFMFERDFIGYLNEQGISRMHEVMPRVVAAYEDEHSWEFAKRNPRDWFHLLRPRTASNDPPTTGVPSVSDQTGAVPRFALIDMDEQLIVGNSNAATDAIRLPIQSQGKQVGWLAMVPFEKAIESGDVRFYNSQMRAFWANGAVSVALAAAIALLLTNTLLKRLKILAQFVHRLMQGDYSQRIPVTNRDELDQLAGDISQLASKLENIEHNRRTFMADISHELRTPLAVLKAELEAIQDGIRPLTQATLAPLQSVVQQMNKLVDDLHDLALTQTGQFTYHFAPLDLNRLAHAVATNMQARAADAGLDLQCRTTATALYVQGDESRLLQLLSNLLENAIRYTDQGGSIQLIASRDHDMAQVVIQDSTPGVDADSCAHLFDRFYRVEASRNRASGGSGLGLAICRNIVESHGGGIAADASPLGGLRIRIQLPVLAHE